MVESNFVSSQFSVLLFHPLPQTGAVQHGEVQLGVCLWGHRIDLRRWVGAVNCCFRNSQWWPGTSYQVVCGGQKHAELLGLKCQKLGKSKASTHKNWDINHLRPDRFIAFTSINTGFCPHSIYGALNKLITAAHHLYCKPSQCWAAN